MVYMSDNVANLEATINSRKDLYSPTLEEDWKSAQPIWKETEEGEQILEINGFEVMASYQIPYMRRLAEVVTQNGGNILNIGYGLGLIDSEIEQYRETCHIDRHYVIELNHHVAAKAREVKNLIVIEDDWRNAIKTFSDLQFDGIVYDGYPLQAELLHRDSIVFVEEIVQEDLLKENGVLTFFADAAESFGEEFISYLNSMGFNYIETEKVSITPPNRHRQAWDKDHFLVPTVKYNK